jgi:hypothetical protein
METSGETTCSGKTRVKRIRPLHVRIRLLKQGVRSAWRNATHRQGRHLRLNINTGTKDGSDVSDTVTLPPNTKRE